MGLLLGADGGRENPQFAGRARMRDGGHTKSVHDAPTTNDRNSTPRHTFTRSTSGVIIFGAAGGRTRTVRVRHGRLIK